MFLLVVERTNLYPAYMHSKACKQLFMANYIGGPGENRTPILRMQTGCSTTKLQALR